MATRISFLKGNAQIKIRKNSEGNLTRSIEGIRYKIYKFSVQLRAAKEFTVHRLL